ncbi:unnamed protein product [Sphagnum balticum]
MEGNRVNRFNRSHHRHSVCARRTRLRVHTALLNACVRRTSSVRHSCRRRMHCAHSFDRPSTTMAPYLPDGRDVAYVNENALAHMPITTLLPQDDDGTAANQGPYTFALAPSGGGDAPCSKWTPIRAL